MSNSFLYKESCGLFELFSSGISTINCLSHLKQDTPINITSFGATCFRSFGFATEEDIPKIETVKELSLFLNAEYDIGLMLFEAELKDIGKLYSEYDIEIHLTFNNRTLLLAYLQKIVPAQYYGLIINALLENPNIWISCDRFGKIQKYHKLDRSSQP